MWAGARPGMDVERKYTSFYYWGMPRASPVIMRLAAGPLGPAMQRRVNRINLCTHTFYFIHPRSSFAYHTDNRVISVFLPGACSRSPPTTPRAPCARAARLDIHI